ncbi:serine hydrolase domain-containing protein [Flavisolibacter tropicus]|uniref:Beta-lactamase-related domain-containing protein n=1 Tax=Flavisolibacter tropicus TaxID=1492898 RepID=A0A172TVT5_9BACT|nr:serine hydrolase domain-containing protein [Flavisolibacter tropicus]ANE50903.1 hypothetical protein SY85_10705 [Flavisolibacter tropicus]
MQPNSALTILKTFKFHLLIALSFAGFTASTLKAQTIHSIQDSIDFLLSSWSNKQAPGISVAVIKDGQAHYSRSYGMANIKKGISIDSATTFWIASVSKQFTAAAIYQLAVQKKLVLDNSIRVYFPKLPPVFQKITVNQLIHHTSGMRDGFVLTALSKKPPATYTNENVMHYLQASAALNFTPGTEYEYNNSCYVLLAQLIEKLTGKTYPDYMKAEVFQPLGMNRTYVSPTFPNDEKQAEGYRESGPNTYREDHFQGKTYGSSSIITTLNDLIRWSQFLQNPQTVPQLSPVAKLLMQPGMLSNRQLIAYAGGLEKLMYRGRTLYEHFGADEGFKADILYFPETKVSVIGLTNNSSYYGLLTLLLQVSDVVHDGKRAALPSVDQSGEKIQEQFYYNEEKPQLAKVQRFPGYVTISSAPSGYAAPFQVIGDTLRNLDPIPAQYLQKKQSIEVLDPYYHNTTRLHEIQPVVKKEDWKTFAGEYLSKELQTSYKIMATDSALQFEFLPGLTFDLFRITDTDFVFEYLGANYLQFSKDGFAFTREGCRKLEFRRQ